MLNEQIRRVNTAQPHSGGPNLVLASVTGRHASLNSHGYIHTIVFWKRHANIYGINKALGITTQHAVTYILCMWSIFVYFMFGIYMYVNVCTIL